MAMEITDMNWRCSAEVRQVAILTPRQPQRCKYRRLHAPATTIPSFS
jgi:hypothetical protein